MTSSQYGPYGQGCTRTTMPGTKGSKIVRWSKSPKTGPSSDCRLQLDGMKLESLVMAHQLRRREYVPKPVVPEVTVLTARRQAPKVWLVIGMKS